jgi:predicted RND superfamily exporter protein
MVRNILMEKILKHPWVVIGVIAAITVFFSVQLPKAELDNDMQKFLPKDNEVYIISEYLKEIFGEEIGMFIGLERKYGTVFDQAFLSRIREFQETVEDFPIVKEVTSILTMPYITAEGDSIVIADLVDDDFSGTPGEIAELKRRLSSWELYDGVTVSDNFSATQIIVVLNISTEDLHKPGSREPIEKIRRAADKIFSDVSTVYMAGEPILVNTMDDSMATDLQVLIPLVLVVILTVLVFSFRRLTFVAMPILTVVITAIWTVGAMPLLGFKLSVIMIILPIILIAVGSAYGIHLISHYLDDAKGKILSKDEHRILVFSVLRKMFKPVMLAALTTIAGFASFCFAWLAPMRHFGYFSCFGVIVSLFVAITLIPAILLICVPGKEKAVKQVKSKKISRFDTALGDILTTLNRKKGTVIMITAAVVVFSVYGVSKLIVDNSMIEYFREDSDVGRSDRFIREYFGGSTTVTVAVEADSTEELLTPEVLTALDNLSAHLMERVPHVGKVLGFPDMIKRMNQMFNVDESPDGYSTVITADSTEVTVQDDGDFGFGDFVFDDLEEEEPSSDPGPFEPPSGSIAPPASSSEAVTFAMLNAAAGKRRGMTANELVRELERQANYEGRAYYEIPSDPARYGKTTTKELGRLIANYLVLVGGDNDGGYANDPLEPTAIQSSIRINSKWQIDTKTVIDAVNDYVSVHFPKNVRVVVGGFAALQGEMTTLVMRSQILSIVLSIFVVIIILTIANRSFVVGLFAAIPLSLAILCNFGIMGLLGITLNMGTALIASLAVGIGIDYTIHFMEFFKTEYQAGGDYLHRTFTGCGKAILINAVSVGAGFAVLFFSQFRMIAELGGLVALSMIITAIISLTLMPVLFETIKPKFIFGINSVSR